jgi:hypothetical protein
MWNLCCWKITADDKVWSCQLTLERNTKERQNIRFILFFFLNLYFADFYVYLYMYKILYINMIIVNSVTKNYRQQWKFVSKWQFVTWYMIHPRPAGAGVSSVSIVGWPTENWDFIFIMSITAPLGIRPCFHRVKWPGHEDDRSSPYNSEVKSVWNCTSIPSCSQIWCLIRGRGNFTDQITEAKSFNKNSFYITRKRLILNQ